MKIFKTAPQQGDIYSHEAPTAKVLLGLTWFFILISAATVTAAWSVYLQDLTASLGGLKWPLLITWGLIFVLPIEVMIFELSKYFWRSIIKGYWKGIHAFQFVVATILLLLGLAYSGFMSQTATKSAMVEAAPEQRTINTAELDQAYRQQTHSAASQFSENADATEKRYAAMEKAAAKEYGAKIDGLQSEYARYEAKGSKYRYRVTQLSREIAAAETAKAKKLSDLAVAKSEEIAGFQAAKLSAENEAAKLRTTNLSILEAAGAGSNAAKAKFSRVFSTLISIVAAVAVLFVFFLACFIELFYHRTGIKRVVVAENEDVSGSVILDVVRFPFVATSRHLAAWIGRKYARLPDVTPPRAPDVIYDAAGIVAPVVAAVSQPQRMTKQPDIPPNLVPIANTAPPPFSRALANTEYTSPAKPVEPVAEEQKPEPAKPLSPFSLKDSKPGNDPAKSEPAKEKKLSAEVEARIIAAFKNPVRLAGFYEVIGFSPAEFGTAFDYLEKLKKTARNSATAANNPKGTDGTRAANQKRLTYVRAELGRMSVGIIPGDAGPGSIKFSWLNEAEMKSWVEKIGQGAIA